ncbi:MAG: thioredoxin family protein [Rikenellaceae bacterium]|nr:thioredoxin family protein [Rikenellaceae bacterium]
MKKLLVIILSMLIIPIVSAQSGNGITFKKITLSEARSAAAQEEKMIFVDVYTTWCPPCKFMDEKIFPQKEVGDYFNSNFINTKFDAGKGEGIKIAEIYNIKNYPTYLILDKEGKELGRITGMKEAGVLIDMVEKIRNGKKD